MKNLVEAIVGSKLQAEDAISSLSALSDVIQIDANGKIVIGYQNSYLEITPDNIALVFQERKLGIQELLQSDDVTRFLLSDVNVGTDEDIDEFEERLTPLGDTESVLDLSEPEEPESFVAQSTVILESSFRPPNYGSANQWNDREFDLSTVPVVPFCRVVSPYNKFELDPGTYNILARSPTVHTDASATRLRRDGDGQTWVGSAIQSLNENQNAAVTQESWVFAAVVVKELSTFRFQHYYKLGFIRSGINRSLGAEAGIPGTSNVYCQIMITRIAE
ncbi:MAG: hypothetical protein F6K53_20065 [Moorea sp. SIO4A1]|uniref:hypothetical protein n=1 Tax=Moorena sp. SIO4A1 TaxID=2607835 RepID=UPI001418C7CA|nr:hypothetical protein [Moorena sp. SIO4A1]NEO43304.1 hypothetical protein [Moorena sp. SIO4A3]NEQ59567.1 hypothetical protein [Moorena sp. SIO4A1]